MSERETWECPECGKVGEFLPYDEYTCPCGATYGWEEHYCYTPSPRLEALQDAAPDLLVACEGLVAIEGGTVCNYCGRHATKHQPQCPVKLATAAISKAKGGE